MECIILAGGLGTRLQSVVSNVPKPLAMVKDKPFLSYLLELLISKGVTKFIFSLGYLSEQIQEYLNYNYSHLSIEYVVEKERLGTGGALKFSLNFATSENVLVVNADTYLDFDINQMSEVHNRSGADFTIAIKKMFDFDRYGSVSVNNENKVVDFQEKIFKNEGYINGGFFFIKKNVFNDFHENQFSLEEDFLKQNLQNLFILGFSVDGYFIDIGVPTDYRKFQLDIENNENIISF